MKCSAVLLVVRCRLPFDHAGPHVGVDAVGATWRWSEAARGRGLPGGAATPLSDSGSLQARVSRSAAMESRSSGCQMLQPSATDSRPHTEHFAACGDVPPWDGEAPLASTGIISPLHSSSAQVSFNAPSPYVPCSKSAGPNRTRTDYVPHPRRRRQVLPCTTRYRGASGVAAHDGALPDPSERVDRCAVRSRAVESTTSRR
jgi:hypothetical protein